MTDEQRASLRKATQNARALLENEFSEQLEGQFDIRPSGTIPDEPGAHLDDKERLLREKLVTDIEHREAGGMTAREAVAAFVREAAFTTLNRFVALKMLEERGVVKECVSSGQQSSGFKEFTMLAPGLSELPDGGYRLYLESLFDEVGQEVQVLFDRRAVAGRLWPRRQALEDLLGLLNQDALAGTWQEAEAIGWVYQYFNADSERQEMRDASSTPRNSYELAVRNQFFTPHYVVQFLTDNTLGRTWHEMQKGDTRLRQRCDYFAERPGEVFLEEGEVPPEPAPDGTATEEIGAGGDGAAGLEAEAPETSEADEEGPTYVPHRPKKDPRDLRILDPACGSGHFLLYAFELLLPIYEEAWEDPGAPASEATGRTLREDYDSLEALRRALPQLILRHNLFGVDIDARAVQIAAFALWMRAQEAYGEADVPMGECPPITRTGVVVAEPMPGEEALREEFLDSLEEKALRPLVERVFERMELAGEAGTLLRIEEEIRDTIREARQQAPTLFDEPVETDEDFWQNAEGKIYRALERYAEEHAGGEAEGLRRQLFAGDAAAGFAFVDLCRQRYDVVLMNPPFGEPADSTKSYIDEQYPNSKSDILQAFVERAQKHLQPAGYLGAITSRTSFFLSSAQSWRERVVLRRYRPHLLADFGHGVLDAMVETAAYVFRALNETEERARTQALLPDLKRAETNSKGKFSVPKYMEVRSDDLKRHQAERELERLLETGLIADASGRYAQYTRRAGAIRRLEDEDLTTTARPPLTCFRLLEAVDKGRALYEAVRETGDARRFCADPATFADVPGAPFAYWVSDRVRRLFQELPAFGSNGRTAKQGLATAKDFRFVRCWWEVPAPERCPPEVHPEKWSGPYCVREPKWFPLAKGGAFSPFYSDLHLVLNWYQHGKEVEAFPNSYIRNPDYYFRPGLTWSLRTTSAASFRAYPAGSVFGHKGPVAFLEQKRAGLAILQSSAFAGLISLQLGAADAAARSYEVGIINRTPVPSLHKPPEKLARATAEAQKIKQEETSGRLASRVFRPPILFVGNTPPKTGVDMLFKQLAAGKVRLNDMQSELCELAFDLYGLDEEDRKGLETSLSESDSESGPSMVEEVDEEAAGHDLTSYAIGCAFGRWDVRYATGERELPDLPEPFDPLPVCPPGMLTGEDGLPLTETPAGYPLPDVPADGILVDDPGHDRDMLGRMHETLGLMFEDEAAAEREACDLLDESDLRSYFRKTTGFFKAHRKQYSKSRRKAPIYWQLATDSTDYSVWLYYPKLTTDTFYRVLDLVREKIRHEERTLDELHQQAGDTPSASQREAIADQEDLVGELRAFQQEIERIAPLWKPNRNDGVVINYAPLWRLVGHNRSWQKECKKHWDRLAEGEYDWAHWAMHLWPERVVPKCAERRDLAIAHGLEEVFWEKDAEGDWHAREEPLRPVEELVEERTSPSVHAARDELMRQT